jgi:hypothetical protein
MFVTFIAFYTHKQASHSQNDGHSQSDGLTNKQEQER